MRSRTSRPRELLYVGNLGSNCLEGPTGYPCMNPSLGDGTGANGIFWREGSRVSPSSVTDGLSATFLAGRADHGGRPVERMGSRQPVARLNRPPAELRAQPPTTLWPLTYNFRSRHPGGANFALCDGSVPLRKGTIDFRVYQALSTRNLREIVPDDAF